MSLPANGSISLAAVAVELQSASRSLTSLSALAGKPAPHGLLEFRGYSYGPAVPSLIGSYNTATGRNEGTVSASGGAMPQTFELQSATSADYSNASPVAVASNGSWFEPFVRRSGAFVVYYRARATAQNITSDWRLYQITVPGLEGLEAQ